MKIWLYQTWARPDLVRKGVVASLESMQAEIHAAYAAAAKNLQLAGAVPVGDSLLAAVAQNIADNPLTPDREGPLNIWGDDIYHPSSVGTYLSALMFYGAIYGADPRDLPADNVAARHIKLSPEASRSLQLLAWDGLAPLRPVAKAE